MFADVRRFQQLDFWPGVRKTSLSRNLLVRFLLSDTIRGSAAGEELLAFTLVALPADFQQGNPTQNQILRPELCVREH